MLHPPGPPPARGSIWIWHSVGQSPPLLWRLSSVLVPPPVPGSGGDCAPSLALDGFRGPLRDCNCNASGSYPTSPFAHRDHSLFLPRSRSTRESYGFILRVTWSPLSRFRLYSRISVYCSLSSLSCVQTRSVQFSDVPRLPSFRSPESDSIHCFGRLCSERRVSDSIPSPQKTFSHGHRTPERETFNWRQTT